MDGQLNILHVEDDLTDALLIEKSLKGSLLKPNCNSITQVSKLSEALKELENHSYNVVLLDLTLADVSGLDNLRCIKEENPNIPIIVVTGNFDENIAKKALIEGAQEFLFKGQSSGDILKRIITSSIIRKSAENDLYEQLHYDYLTQIPNRFFFKKMCETLISRAQRRKTAEGLLFLDLDGFKNVNDTYGHEAGNYVLVETAQRMKNALRASDVLARYAGDEFCIYLDSQDSGITKKDCIHIVENLIRAIERPIFYRNQSISISTSIGISLFPHNGMDYATLIESADQAMYIAKRQNSQKYSFADEIVSVEPSLKSVH